jgi:hypothetical protein
VRDGIRWGGRVIALASIAGASVYLWRVGLNRGASIASVGAFLVAIVALIAPYLFPPEREGAMQKEAMPEISTGQARSEHGASSHAPLVGGLPGQAVLAPPASSQAIPEVPGPPRKQASKADAEDALLRFSDIDDPSFRLQLLREMGDRLALDGPFQVAYHAMARDHVFAIVGAVWAFREPDLARQALADAAERMRPHEAAAAQLREVI